MSFKNIDIPIIEHLSENFFINEEKLSDKLSISREDVKKQIQLLKKLGYNFYIDNLKGYRIIKRPDILLPFEIKNNLATRYIGKSVYYFPELTSTNSVANQMVRENTDKIPEGTIVIADKQGAGKGRSGKKWFSPVGGVWFSVVLYPKVDPSHISLMTLTAAVAVVKAINRLYSQININIKWPNDILINGRKVCGILTEMNTEGKKIKWIIVGVGINVNNCSYQLPEDISKGTISLKEVTGKSISRVKLIQHLCIELEKVYEVLKEKSYSAILEEWKSYNNIIGKEIKVNTGENIITGKAIDINEKGTLIIKTKIGEIKEIISGIVSPLKNGEG